MNENNEYENESDKVPYGYFSGDIYGIDGMGGMYGGMMYTDTDTTDTNTTDTDVPDLIPVVDSSENIAENNFDMDIRLVLINNLFSNINQDISMHPQYSDIEKWINTDIETLTISVPEAFYNEDDLKVIDQLSEYGLAVVK